MTIHIAAAPTARPAVARSSVPQPPADDMFSAALRAKSGAGTPPATAAGARPTVHLRAVDQQLPTRASVTGDEATVGGNTAPAAAPKPQPLVDDAASDSGSSGFAAQAAAAVTAVAGIALPTPSALPGPIPTTPPGIDTTPGVAATPTPGIAAAPAGQAEAIPAVADVVVPTQLHPAVIGQPVLDAEAAGSPPVSRPASEVPGATGAATGTAGSYTAASTAGSGTAATSTSAAGPPHRIAEGLAAKAGPVAFAEPDPDAPMEAASRPAPSVASAVAANSLGAASGTALPAGPATTGVTDGSVLPDGAPGSMGATGTLAVEPGPTPLEATAAQHVVARAALDTALTERPRADAVSAGAPSAGAAAPPDKPDAAPPSGRPAEAVTLPAIAPVPAPAVPSHAPSVTAASASTPAHAAAPPPAVHSQILSALTPALHRWDGSYSVDLQLDPATLGRVRIQLNVAGGQVSLHLASGDAATRDLIRQHMDQLRQQLADAGFDRSSVDVGDGSRGNPWPEAQDRQSYPPAGGQGGGPGQHAGRGGQRPRSRLDQPVPAADHDHPEQVHRAIRAHRGDGPLDVRI